MNKRIIIIDKCSLCNKCTFDGDEEYQWGKHWCDILNVEVSPDSIPDNCPLPVSNPILEKMINTK